LSALSVEEYVRGVARTLRAVETLRALPTAAPRIDAHEWAVAKATLRTADGRVLRYADVRRDYQDALLRDTARRVIVAKSRQIGISQTVAFIVAAEMRSGGTALIISRDQVEAGRFLRYVRTAIAGDPDAPPLATDNTYELEFATGGQAIAQPATPKAGRGIPATLVVLDEQAWQAYAALIWTAVTPTLATTGGRLIVLSSVNGQGNLFHELWRGATEDATPSADTEGGTRGEGNGWSWHFLPWQVHPDWRAIPDWEERKKAEDRLTDEAFAQEYGVDFLLSGSARFDPEEIAALWKMPALLPAEPGHRYVSAWDIARKRDAFVGFTLDVSTSPFRVVAYERHLRLDYPAQAAAIEARHRAYPGETWVESNGVGDPLIQFLTVPVKEFTTTVLTKRNALDALKLLMQRRELISPRLPEWERELAQYQDQDQHLTQDTVMASAIAALAAGRPVRQSYQFNYRRGVA
jgi:hypothetical protein